MADPFDNLEQNLRTIVEQVAAADPGDLSVRLEQVRISNPVLGAQLDEAVEVWALALLKEGYKAGFRAGVAAGKDSRPASRPGLWGRKR